MKFGCNPQNKQEKGNALLTLATRIKATSFKALGAALHMSMQKTWHQTVAYGIQPEVAKLFKANRNGKTVVVKPVVARAKHVVPDSSNAYSMVLNSTDFWKFYQKNQRAVDNIIQIALIRHTNRLDINDAKQEILMRLKRCNVLESYNSNRSQLHTWLTNLVGRYVQTLLKIETKKPTWEPWPTQKIEGESNHRPMERAVYQSMNGISDGKKEECEFFGHPMSGSNSVPWELSDSEQENIEDRLWIEDLVRVLKSKLTPEIAHLVDLLNNGSNASEVARMLGVSPQFVLMKMSKIKEIGEKIMHRERAVK